MDKSQKDSVDVDDGNINSEETKDDMFHLCKETRTGAIETHRTPIMTENEDGSLEKAGDAVDEKKSIENIHLGTAQGDPDDSVSRRRSSEDEENDVSSNREKLTEHQQFIPDSSSATAEGTPILTEKEDGSLDKLDDAVDNKKSIENIHLGAAQEDSCNSISIKISYVAEENDMSFSKRKTPILTKNEAGSLENADGAVDNKKFIDKIYQGTAQRDSGYSEMFLSRSSCEDEENDVSPVKGKLTAHQHLIQKNSSATADEKPILAEIKTRSVVRKREVIDDLPKTTQHEEPSGHFKGARFVQNYNVDPKSGRILPTSVQVILYTAHLKSWPRVYKSQQLIKGMIDRSAYLENMLGLRGPHDDTTNELFQIDIYMHSSVKQSPESLLVRGNSINEIERLTVELSETITDPTQELLGKQFLGIFIDKYGAKLIEAISNTKIVVRSLPECQAPAKELEPKQFTDCDTIKFQISSLLEKIVFEKLSMKCKILSELRMITNPKYYTAIDGRENENYVSNLEDKNNEYKDAVDDLLGEMIALFKRSKLPKDVHPVIEGYEKKTVSEKVYKGLFNLDDTIRGCGYRYSTFNVNIVNSTDEKERMERIRNFLKTHEIYYVKFNFVTQSTSEYKCVGSTFSVVGSHKKREKLYNATLGAYASFRKEGKTSPSALISKHITQFSINNKLLAYAKQDEKPIEMGAILKESVNEGGYDIAAATIHEDYMKQCDVRFKNEDNEPKLGIIYTSDLGIDLQDQHVHLWGAVSKPGLGVIRIPEVIYPDSTETYVQVEDRDALGGVPFENMATEGDSGAILCCEDLDDEYIYVISMLIGGISDTTDCKNLSSNIDDGENVSGASSSPGNINAPSEICTNVRVENCDSADSEKILYKRKTDKNGNSIVKSGIDMHQNSPLKSDADGVYPENKCSNSGDTGTFPKKEGTGNRGNVPPKRQYMAFLLHKGIKQLENVTEGVFELKGIADEK